MGRTSNSTNILKVGLNATCFNDRPSGAKQRFFGLFPGLIRKLSFVEFVVFEAADSVIHTSLPAADNLRFVKTTIPSEGRYRKAVYSWEFWNHTLKKERFDIFECFNFPMFKSHTGCNLITIHDIRALKLGGSVVETTLLRYLIRRAGRDADFLLTVSDAMKQEIAEFFPPQKTVLIPNGLDVKAFQTLDDRHLSYFKDKFSLPDEFVLAVGHLEPRKNYTRLLQAAARMRRRGIEFPLVIIGNDSGETGKIRNLIRTLGLSKSAQILTNLSDAEVRCAYSLCHLFIFPSVYEGFGIPLLEAMAAGCPIVLSDIAVFREITEGNGLFFNPLDVDEMTIAIERGLTNTEERLHLRDYGLRRVWEFDFTNIIPIYESLYRKILYHQEASDLS